MATGSRCPAKLQALRCCFAFGKAYRQDDASTSDQEESLDDISTAASTPNEVSEADGNAMIAVMSAGSQSPSSHRPSLELQPSEVTVTSGESGGAALVTHDWWCDVDPTTATDAGLTRASNLVAARVIHEEDPKVLYDPVATLQLYEEMLEPRIWKRTDYVAVWLGMGPRWLVYLCEATGDALRDSLESGAALKQRVKLILRPVKVRLPFPSSPPKDAEFVGPYFGDGATMDKAMLSQSGSQIYGLRVNLYGNWLVKLGLQHIGLQPGNCLDLLVIDWPSRLLLASIRLTITQAFKDQRDTMPQPLDGRLRHEA